MRYRGRWGWVGGTVAAALVVAGVAVQGQQAGSQGEAPDVAPYYERHTRGQNIAPAYEGWESNPDGSFTLHFGYFNRNWEEQPHVPIGPNNTVEPGGPDRGQPTHFFPRRNKFVFTVNVPKDFGSKELIWTLIVNGKAEKAYATLKPDYALDKYLIQVNSSMSFSELYSKNQAPVVRLDGERQRTVKVGQPLALNAMVTDDGILKARPLGKGPNGTDFTALGLRVAWFVYRGPGGQVSFTPEQFKVYQDKTPGANSPFAPGWAPPLLPADNKFPVAATFKAPGTYVIRLSAHDGGLETTGDTTVTVVP